MGRFNSASSSNYAEVQSAPVTNPLLTVMLWFKPVSGSVGYELISICNPGEVGHYQSFVSNNGVANTVAMVSQGAPSAEAEAVSPAILKAGQWNCAIGVVYSAASRAVWLNFPTQKGTNTGSKTTDLTSQRISLGVFRNAGGTFSPINGQYAYGAIWNDGLTDGHAELLMRRRLVPWAVRPDALQCVWCTQFDNGVFSIKNVNPWRNRGQYDLAITGTLRVDDTPWLFDPAGPAARAWVYSFGRTTTGIAFDAASNSGAQVAQSLYSWSHTCTGSNRFLAVDISLLSAGATVTSITYNGVALSPISGADGSTVTSFGRVECWGLANPASGTNGITVTLSGSITSVGSAVSYAGVHQTTPTEAGNFNQATNVGSATDATVAVTSVADQCWIHAAIAVNDASVTAGQTTRNNVVAAAAATGADEDFGPQSPGAKTMNYTALSITSTWAIAGYAIRPVSAASVGTFTKLLGSGGLAGIGSGILGPGGLVG